MLDSLSGAELAVGKIERDLGRPRVHFLYFHAVPPPSLSGFRSLVRTLSRNADFASHSDAVNALLTGQKLHKPVVSFSFDDGFVSNVAAAHVLEHYGAVGMFFVPTAFIGTPDVGSARAFFGMTAGVDEPAMTWGQIEGLRARGHEIGNHTVNHRVLSDLSDDEAAEEVGAARDELVQRLGTCEHFAWPRGLFHHTTEKVSRHAFALGHASIASAVRGSHRPGRRPVSHLCLRRDHVMSEWPLRHNLHFVARAARHAGRGDWPEEWSV